MEEVTQDNMVKEVHYKSRQDIDINGLLVEKYFFYFEAVLWESRAAGHKWRQFS